MDLMRQAMARLVGWDETGVEERLIPLVGDLLFALINRAARMCESAYAGAGDIDTAIRLGSGLRQGPLEMANQIGLDLVHNVLSATFEKTADPRYWPSPILPELGSAGRHFPVLAVEPGISRLRADTDGRPPAGVCGTGIMAAGMAEVFATAGHPVLLVGRTLDKAVGARAAIHTSLGRLVPKGRIREDQRDLVLARVTPTDQFDGLYEAAIVMEAVVEDLAVKQELFRRLDQVCSPGAILATTTSSLPVAQCATVTSRPDAVIGLHFFNPAPVMRLIEVVSTVHTAPPTTAATSELCEHLGMRAVHCGDRPGFIVNALILPYMNDAIRLAGEHRLAPDVLDGAVQRSLGFPFGPLAMADIVGLDVLLAALEILHEASNEFDLVPAAMLRARVADGFYGRKAGRGFYVYPRVA